MIILLLAILKFALFLALVGGLALLIGSALGSLSQLGDWAASRMIGATPSGLDPAVAAALDCKSDLARGERETADILAQSHSGCGEAGGASSGSDSSCDGGGDGGGGD